MGPGHAHESSLSAAGTHRRTLGWVLLISVAVLVAEVEHCTFQLEPVGHSEHETSGHV